MSNGALVVLTPAERDCLGMPDIGRNKCHSRQVGVLADMKVDRSR